MATRVIVEGPDGGGKTTLIKQLVKDTGLTVLPRASDSAKGPIPNIGHYIDSDLTNHDRKGIYDRHPLISEFVYGPLIRGHMEFGHMWQSLDGYLLWLTQRVSMLYAYDPVVIYCLPPWEYVSKHVWESDTPQMPGVKESLLGIFELYIVQYAKDQASHHRVHRWDYTQPDNYRIILADIRSYL